MAYQQAMENYRFAARTCVQLVLIYLALSGAALSFVRDAHGQHAALILIVFIINLIGIFEIVVGLLLLKWVKRNETVVNNLAAELQLERDDSHQTLIGAGYTAIGAFVVAAFGWVAFLFRC
jgi:hypothetical protein